MILGNAFPEKAQLHTYNGSGTEVPSGAVGIDKVAICPCSPGRCKIPSDDVPLGSGTLTGDLRGIGVRSCVSSPFSRCTPVLDWSE